MRLAAACRFVRPGLRARESVIFPDTRTVQSASQLAERVSARVRPRTRCARLRSENARPRVPDGVTVGGVVAGGVTAGGVTAGGEVATVQVRLAGVASAFPAPSDALTSKLCEPSPTPLYERGEEHAAQ